MAGTCTEGDSGRELRSTPHALRHQEAARRRKTTAVYYLTSVAAAIGVAMIAEGALPGPGVYPAEVLDPARVFAEWAARDLPIERSESVVPN